MVTGFAHGDMGHWVNPSWNISRSSQCSTTGVTKAVVCAFLSVVIVLAGMIFIPCKLVQNEAETRLNRKQFKNQFEPCF